MKSIAVAAVALPILALSFLPASDAGPSHSHFVVHEWGTFTSMQGSNGAVLEGLHHEEEALPSFVHNLGSGAEPVETRGKGLTRVRRVTQKMETPVIYFYSDKPRTVDVSVQFDKGIVSEWYPAATRHDAWYRRYSDVLDLGTVRSSSIRWKLDLVPRDRKSPTNIPDVDADDPWAYARNVGSSYVTTKANKGESEHYVFYRGLGARKLPVRVVSDRSGKARVFNDSSRALPAAFVLEYGPSGARFVSLGSVKAGTSKSANVGSVPLVEGERVVSQLRARVLEALVASGLYEDEATAMVKTWSRQWFTSEGTRLIYLVPRKLTDELLPINISPKPDKLVRTLVGRLEFITPATAKEVERAVVDRYHANRTRKRRAVKRLDRLGRFLEPHVRNALATTTSERVRVNAKRLLADIQQASNSGAPASGALN